MDNDGPLHATDNRPEDISDDDQRERDGVHPTEYDLQED